MRLLQSIILKSYNFQINPSKSMLQSHQR